MKNASRLTRLRRMADELLPADPDDRILFMGAVRTTPQQREAGFVPEMIIAHAYFHGRLPGTGDLGTFRRTTLETEDELLERVRAALRPHTKRSLGNVTSYSFDDNRGRESQ